MKRDGSRVRLDLGGHRFDLRRRAVVIGILNRTRDSFHDRDAYFTFDRFLEHAERLVVDGADVLEVGARPGGAGVWEVTEGEETELVGQSLESLRKRFDVALAVDTQRARVAAAALSVGASLANDMSGFRDPDYLPVAAAAGAAVIATHSRLAPGIPDPHPMYADVVEEVAGVLAGLRERARDAGISSERIVLDPGFDLGKTWEQTLELLANVPRFAALGGPVMIAVSNKIFLARTLGLGGGDRTTATVAACAFGVARGGRVLRVHDVRAGREVADLLAALIERDGSLGRDGSIRPDEARPT